MNRRIFLFLLFLTTFLLSGCIVKQTAEHLSGATIKNGLGESFFHLSPKEGQNEVLILRRHKTYLFPPVGNLTYLFIEMKPELVTVDKKYDIPSENVFGRVCQEVHPGFWCGPITGEIKIFEITQNRIDCRIYIEAKPEGGYPSERGYQSTFGGEYSFIKTKK